jgi:hypothetical protein
MGGLDGFSVNCFPAVVAYCVAQDAQAQQLYIHQQILHIGESW